MKITQQRAQSFELPSNKSEAILFDDLVPGFGLRVRGGGSKNWVVQYKVGKKNRRMTLGSIKLLNAEKARKSAQEVLARVRLGEDPQAQRSEKRHASENTFKSLAADFLEMQEKRSSKRYSTDNKRYLLSYAKSLNEKKLKEITRIEISKLLSVVAARNGEVTADRMRSALSSFFSWVIREGHCETNPVSGTNRFSLSLGRDRVLAKREIKTIWQSLPEGDFGSILKLLFLTGQRREEIGGLRWEEVDYDRKLLALPAFRTKNKRPHEIPLSPLAMEIMSGLQRLEGRELVFGKGEGSYQGYGKAKRELDSVLVDLVEWRIHDVRRTVATGMAEIGVQPHIVEAVLNHVSGYRSGVAGIYNRAAYSNEKRDALNSWADELSSILSGGQIEFPEK